MRRPPPRTWYPRAVHMVKSLSAILVAAALLAGAALFERAYVETSFSGFHAELTALYEKTDARQATLCDARAVQRAWETRKQRLQIFLPHADAARADAPLAEAVRLIGEEEYTLALVKLEVLLHLAETFPDSYRATSPNIF